jgi:hypothetical protein
MSEIYGGVNIVGSLTIDLTKQVVLTEKYLIQYKEKKTNKCAICHHIPSCAQ